VYASHYNFLASLVLEVIQNVVHEYFTLSFEELIEYIYNIENIKWKFIRLSAKFGIINFIKSSLNIGKMLEY